MCRAVSYAAVVLCHGCVLTGLVLTPLASFDSQNGDDLLRNAIAQQSVEVAELLLCNAGIGLTLRECAQRCAQARCS